MRITKVARVALFPHHVVILPHQSDGDFDIVRIFPKNVFTIFPTGMDNVGMRESYASDTSREKFEEILPLLQSVRKRTKPTTVDLYEVFCAVLYLLRSGCQWRMLPRDFPKWRTVHSYFAKWSEPAQHGISVLEWALKKSGWRGPRETGAQRQANAVDRGRAERQEHGYGR